MTGMSQVREKRNFLRFPYKKNIRYRKLLLDEHKILIAKSGICIAKNLSSSGILFSSKDRPNLSDIILLDIDCRKMRVCEGMKKNILMLDNKLLGKVVRVEERADGEYDIGMAFIAKPESGRGEIELFTRHAYLRRGAKHLFILLLILLVAYTTFSVNIIFLEKNETYRPDKEIYTNPLSSMGIFYEDVEVKTDDGQTINGWFIPSKDAKITILYCPGNRGNLCDELARIKFFYDMKINLMIFDYRGYGKSSGQPSEKGFYKDAVAVYDYLISRKDIDKDRIVIIGESLGGPVATNLCLNRKAEALVLESSVVSLALAAKRLYPFLPVDILVSEKYDTLAKIKNIHIPKLFVHGLDDEKVDFDDALKLYYAAPLPKKFLPFQGVHNDDIFKISSKYKTELIKFFKDNNIL